MEALVYGGAASGKSRYAEDLLCALSGEGPRIYLATMEAMDEESRARVRRHRALRQNKGFSTLAVSYTHLLFPKLGTNQRGEKSVYL